MMFSFYVSITHTQRIASQDDRQIKYQQRKSNDQVIRANGPDCKYHEPSPPNTLYD